MIIRVDKCPNCGNQVAVIMPDLFPDINAKLLEKYKRLSLTPIEHYCKKCKKKEEK